MARIGRLAFHRDGALARQGRWIFHLYDACGCEVLTDLSGSVAGLRGAVSAGGLRQCSNEFGIALDLSVYLQSSL